MKLFSYYTEISSIHPPPLNSGLLMSAKLQEVAI